MENNLLNASMEDKTFVIREYFSINTIPEVTRVTCSDDTTFLGYFEEFDDEAELAKQGIFRFVTYDVKESFYFERVKNNGWPDPKYSIVIYVDKIVDLRMISSISGREIQNPRYQNFLNRLHCVTNNFSI